MLFCLFFEVSRKIQIVIYLNKMCKSFELFIFEHCDGSLQMCQIEMMLNLNFRANI